MAAGAGAHRRARTRPTDQGAVRLQRNPVTVAPHQDRRCRAWRARICSLSVSEQFLTDTADYADIVLPATTQLEQFDLDVLVGPPLLTLNQPAIEPLGEAVPNVELFRRLRTAMGSTSTRFPISDEEMALGAMDWSHPPLDGITLDCLRRRAGPGSMCPAPDEYAPHAATAASPRRRARSSCGHRWPSRRQLRAPAVPQGLQRVPGGRPRRPAAPLRRAPRPTTRDAPLPAAFLSPKAHALPELAVRQRRPASGACRREQPQAILHPDRRLAAGDRQGRPRHRAQRARGAARARAGVRGRRAGRRGVPRWATRLGSAQGDGQRPRDPPTASPTSAARRRSRTPRSRWLRPRSSALGRGGTSPR